MCLGTKSFTNVIDKDATHIYKLNTRLHIVGGGSQPQTYKGQRTLVVVAHVSNLSSDLLQWRNFFRNEQYVDNARKQLRYGNEV